MSKFELFTVTFAKEVPIYVGGEKLVAAVQLNVKERLKINSINLTISGASDVDWSVHLVNVKKINNLR